MDKKSNFGRPPKDENDRLSEKLIIRLKVGEKGILSNKAKEDGFNVVSKWIRHKLFDN